MSEKNINGYYGVFKHSADGVEVEFPDLKGCYTFGDDMKEAFLFATDALSFWLEHADDKYIPKTRLTLTEVKQQFPNDRIMFVPVN